MGYPIESDPQHVPESAKRLMRHVHMHVERKMKGRGLKRYQLASSLGIGERHLDEALMDPTKLTISRLAKIMDALELDLVIADRKDLKEGR